MNFLKKLKTPFAKPKKYYTLFTGSHLTYTQDIISQLSKQNKNLEILVLNKNYTQEYEEEQEAILKNNSNNNSEKKTNILDSLDNVQIFNCDVSNTDDIEELTFYLKSNDLKVRNVIHSDHYISCLDHSKSAIYSELKLMTQTNIENAMILNSKLLSSKRLEIDSKIFHLVLPSTQILDNIPSFAHKRMLGQSLKHMVNCCKEDLIKNPVFFSLITIQTLDQIYLKRYENNETLTKEEIQLFNDNYNKSIDLICYLLSDKISGLDFGKKFWNLEDYVKL